MIVTVPFQNAEIGSQFEEIREVLLRNPSVLNVSATNNQLAARVSHWREYEVEGRDEEVMIPTVVVTHDFFSTLQGEIVSGRDFNRDFPTDVREAYIVNESAATFLGLESPVGTSMVGATFTGDTWSEKNAKIIGVVRDFHFTSLHSEIQPAVFSLSSEQTTPLQVMAVRISSTDVRGALSDIEKTWKKFAPGRPLQYSFMADDAQKLYAAEERFLRIFLAFAVLAISVTCLGLLGLSAYVAAQRTKEVGVRKVLGASVANVLTLLASDFVKLVLLGNVLAWPLAWFLAQRWLQGFAYRIDLSVWVFVAAGGLALAIALLTVSAQALRAATTNPVDSLRYE